MMIHSIGDISSCGCHFMASQREGTVGKESFTNTNVLLQVQYVIFALVHHPQNTDGLRISAVLRFVHQYFGLHLVQYFSWKKRKILSFQQGIEIPWSVTKEYFVLHCQQFLIGRRGIVQKEMHRKGGLPDVQKIRFQCKCRFCLFCEQILCQSMQNSLTGCRSNFFEMQRSIADQFDAMELT